YPSVGLEGSGASVAALDLNGDGHADLYVGGNGSSQSFLGDGSGGFQGLPLNDAFGFFLAHGDFNRDGKVDLASTDLLSGRVFVMLGNGDGTFQTPQEYDDLGTATGIATGDFNNDGKLDLAVAIYSSAAFRILLGNGDGTFTVGDWGFVTRNPEAL